MRKIAKRILQLMLLIILFILICGAIFITDGLVEKNKVDELITSFTDRGEFVYEDVNKSVGITYTRRYYKVVKAYDYEEVNNSDRYVFDYLDSDKYIGAKTDIILTNRNPMRNTNIAWFIEFFAKNFYLGHSSINISDTNRLDNKETIEVVGKEGSDKVRYWPNDWFYNADHAPSIIGLRLKNTTSAIRDEIVKEMESKIGMPYNYTFAFDTKNSYYCTDLISRPLEKFGYDLNEDGLFTLGNDLIVSEDVYFIFYRLEWQEGNEVFQEIYYLSED